MLSASDAFAILDVHPHLRPPMWRAMVARHVVADKGSEVVVDTRDAWLMLAIQNEKMLVSRKQYERLPPDDKMRNARSMAAASRPGGLRWMLEAMLCGGATDEQCIKFLKLPFKPADMRAFRRVYFDVDSYVDTATGEISPFALEFNIICCARAQLTGTTSHDYMWKRFAVRFGHEGFITHLRGETTNEQQDWMTKIANVRNLETAVMFSESPERVADAMGPELASAFMKVPENLRASSEKKIGTSMSSDFQLYFDKVSMLVSKASNVYTDRMKLVDIKMVEGRAVQMITSGNLVKNYHQLPVAAEG